MCILCTPQPINRSRGVSIDVPMYRLTCPLTLNRYVGRHIDRLLANIKTEICWLMCRPMYQLRYRPSQGRHIDRLSADISVDIAANTRLIRWPLIVCGKSVNCRWYIGQNLDCQMNKLYAFHPFLVNLKNFWRLHVRPSCAANSVVIKQDTQVKYCQIHKIQLTGKRIRSKKQAWVYLAVGLQNNLQVKLCLWRKLQSPIRK